MTADNFTAKLRFCAAKRYIKLGINISKSPKYL